MRQEQAVAVASSEARRRGIDLSKFAEPAAHFGCDGGACTWLVNYRGKNQLELGNHFRVQVSDSTCSTAFHPGL
jgi:hypothetical protein